MSRRIDMVGKQYGHWTVLSRGRLNEHNKPLAFCRCECGTERQVVAQSLRTGLSKSCGCMKPEAIARARVRHRPIIKHYLGPKTRAYRIWNNTFHRCNNPTRRDYRWYGAKGVKICERWLVFENFIADMGECPDELTLDRINPCGNYEPGNCRWVPWSVQYRNKRKAAQ